jgi:hypothetical protein
MARLDTKLEAEAAEFLVLGQLLLNRIPTFKTYTNMPGYDLIATSPEKNTSARISVKSRWHTNPPHFLIKNFECDFVVFALLNRGSKDGKKEIRDPEFYVIPKSVVRRVYRIKGWGKVNIRHIKSLEKYHSSWKLISDFLNR